MPENPLDKLFRFPIVMIDGNKEEEKQRYNQALAIDKTPEVDIIIGEAECPYYDFISISDRWMPDEDSYQRALKKKFDACSVIFAHSGSFTVPWSKEKFKRELTKFIEGLPKSVTEPRMGLMQITREQLIRELNEMEEEDGNDGEEEE